MGEDDLIVSGSEAATSRFFGRSVVVTALSLGVVACVCIGLAVPAGSPMRYSESMDTIAEFEDLAECIMPYGSKWDHGGKGKDCKAKVWQGWCSPYMESKHPETGKTTRKPMDPAPMRKNGEACSSSTRYRCKSGKPEDIKRGAYCCGPNEEAQFGTPPSCVPK